MELKLKSIIERGRLSPWTAAYVLKNPERLKGMPPGGKQGVHRVFTLEQAFRFAFCTQLVQCGVLLRNAVDVVQHCLKAARAHTGRRNDLPFEAGKSGDGWFLSIFDHAFAHLEFERKPVPASGPPWFEIESKTMVELARREITLTAIDLTNLWSQLQAAE